MSRAPASAGHDESSAGVGRSSYDPGDLVRLIGDDLSTDLETHAFQPLAYDGTAAVIACAGDDAIAHGEDHGRQSLDLLDAVFLGHGSLPFVGYFLGLRARLTDLAGLAALLGLASSSGSLVLGAGRFQ